MNSFRIATERLVLREWREADIDFLWRINSDPEVMAYIGPRQSRGVVARSVAGEMAAQAEKGHCYWPIERRSDGAFIGFCGLHPLTVGMHAEGQIEIGWRLRRDSWGQGLAREAAVACLAWGFANLPVDAIWAKTVPANARSWGLMLRLGMTYVEGGDFDHPALPAGDPLRRHVLYRISRPR
jgi:RimJ/RimL family protein N-acetyltransferase